MHKIVVVQPIHSKGMKVLEENAIVVIPQNPSDEAVLEVGEDAVALVIRLSKVSKALMQGLPKLRVIGRNGAGVDNIDVDAASARRIMIINTPGSNANSVAEYVVSAFMCLSKQLCKLDKHCRTGDWQFRDECRGIELEGKSIGIVGMGRIGSSLAGKARLGLGMNVLAYDPFIPCRELEEMGVTPCRDLDAMLGTSDIISIHLPLTDETRGLFNEDRLRKMKHGAILVNTSRGGIVDEDALARLLASGELGGAACDVFRKEPLTLDNPLLGAPNLIVTPHIAGMTEESAARTSEMMAKDVIRALNGEDPVNLHNRGVFPG